MDSVRGWIAVALVAVLAPSGASAAEQGTTSAPIDAGTLAARIDAVLAARWAQSSVQPAPLADDGEFLRRTCLDLIGKIPTAAEAGDFLDDPRSDKRQALVDRLVDSPAYITRATELWRQLLLSEADTENQARALTAGFEAWLRRKVTEDAGYDRIVRELLTVKLTDRNGEASVAVRTDASPAAYYTAKEGKPENLASGVARVFLGIRLECAQCHNHPFGRWKREEFWGFAAFFAGVPQPASDDPPPTTRPTAAPRRELTIPGTKKVVKAAHLDGSQPEWRPRADSRDVLADWITASDNPYFARAVVNRVWARFFGIGLIEPVDDLDVEGEPELGALLDEVAAQFRSHGYNLKYLIRALTATRAYGLSSASGRADSSRPMFASMPVRGLSPGQFFDSLTQATGSDAADARARFLDLFASREERSTDAQTTILQALTMMNGSHVASATSPDTGDVLGAVVKAPFLDTRGRIETLYLAALTRRPSPDELVVLVGYVERRASKEDRAKAFSDIFWALLNGPEFHLNH